jgi:hypothetical protein
MWHANRKGPMTSAQYARNDHKVLEGTAKSSRFRAARSIVVLSLLSVADRAHRGKSLSPAFADVIDRVYGFTA